MESRTLGNAHPARVGHTVYGRYKGRGQNAGDTSMLKDQVRSIQGGFLSKQTKSASEPESIAFGCQAHVDQCSSISFPVFLRAKP